MIEGIIQSTNYADFLSLTLPENRKHFDRLVVYTKIGDEPTKQICSDIGVECIETELFTKGGSKFNRGAVYNQAFASLRFDDWVVILDSDIILPTDFRSNIDNSNLDHEVFYGARRYNIETIEDYRRVQSTPYVLKDYLLYRGYGYGYLQIFNCQSKIYKSLGPHPYPEWVDGSEADWRFRNKWGDLIYDPPMESRGHQEPNPIDPSTTPYMKCLPFHVIHLGITGVNSIGRLTPRW